jgi:inner membrane protein
VPTVFSHAVFAAALYIPFRHHVPRHFALAGAVAAVVPDLDVVAFRFGIPYAHPLGHRGFSHSLVFAAAVAAVTIVAFARSLSSGGRRATWLYVALAIASHGLFDAVTNGGLGVALLAPFTNERFFFPWQPIEVSPLGLSRIFSARGLEVLTSELLWVGVPALAVAVFGLAIPRPVASRSIRVPDN